ncbi:MAG: hypothetical protein CMF41_04380 [Legionellales bacterium]|nr:hypothetical protein [Legionellales bacterium]
MLPNKHNEKEPLFEQHSPEKSSSFEFIWQSAKIFWFDAAPEELWDRYFDLLRLFVLLLGSAVCAYFFTLNMGILMEAYQVGLLEPLISSTITLLTLMVANTWFEVTYMNYAKLLSFKWRWTIQNTLSKLFLDRERNIYSLQKQRDPNINSDESNQENKPVDIGNSVINLGPDVVAGFFEIIAVFMSCVIQLLSASAILIQVNVYLPFIMLAICSSIILVVHLYSLNLIEPNEKGEIIRQEVLTLLNQAGNDTMVQRENTRQTLENIVDDRNADFWEAKFKYYKIKYYFDLANEFSNQFSINGAFIFFAPIAFSLKWSFRHFFMTAEAVSQFAQHTMKLNLYHTQWIQMSTKAKMVQSALNLMGVSDISVSKEEHAKNSRDIKFHRNKNPSDNSIKVELDTQTPTFLNGASVKFTSRWTTLRGPSGCGKSTLFGALVGTRSDCKGSISIPFDYKEGKIWYLGKNSLAALANIQALKIKDFILSDINFKWSKKKNFTPFLDYASHMNEDQKKDICEKINEYLKALDISHLISTQDNTMKSLASSDGQKDRLSIMTLLMRNYITKKYPELLNEDYKSEPEIVILDESLSGISGLALTRTYNLIHNEFNENESLKFIVVTHRNDDLAEINRICNDSGHLHVTSTEKGFSLT